MSERKVDGRREASLGRTVLDDLRKTRIQQDYGRELKDLFRFYLEDQVRAKLSKMESSHASPGRRLFRRMYLAVWLIGQMLKTLLLKLSPARRILLLTALLCGVLGWTRIEFGGFGPVVADFRIWGFAILLIILMLELKDKLLAKDEIQIARQVQVALLPRDHPDLPGWRVWSCSRPANTVGGDLVDYIDMDGFRHGIALGDVAGKGLGAAMLSAKLQATLRALIPEAVSLDDLGHRVNASLYRDGLDNRFATLFYLELEYDSGQIRYFNAGHNPAFLLRGDSVELLRASSFPLGMLPGATYEESTIELEPGQLLLAYSDGLTEAANERDEEFGEERVLALLQQTRDLAPAEIGQRILDEVDRFLGGARPHDDLSLVVIARDS